MLFSRSPAVRTTDQIAVMRRAGRVVAEMHEAIREALKPGVSTDCGAIVEGWHGDAAFTAVVGEASREAEQLIAATDASLAAGIAATLDGNRIGDIGWAVQSVAERAGFEVVRE